MAITPKTWLNAPATTTPLDAAGVIDLETRMGSYADSTAASQVAASLIQPVTSTVPGSPVDGQELYYQADATNGIHWHMRFRSGSPNTHKWEYLGGPAMVASGTASAPNSTAVGTYIALPSGPTITIARAGIYEVGINLDARLTAAIALMEAHYRVETSAGAVVTAAGRVASTIFTAQNAGQTIAPRWRTNTIAASTIIRIGVATTNAAGLAVGDFCVPELWVTPLRFA